MGGDLVKQQPAFMTPRGVIRCAHCRTDDWGLPPLFRMGEMHVSVRFRDNEHQPWRVLFEGEDVTKRTYEAIGGRNGVIYLYDLNSSGHVYACPVNGTHAVIVKHTGRVSVLRGVRS